MKPWLKAVLAAVSCLALLAGASACRGGADYVQDVTLQPNQLASWIAETGPSDGNGNEIPAAAIRANPAAYGYVHLDGHISSSSFTLDPQYGIRYLQKAWITGCIEVDHSGVIIVDVLIDMTDVCHGGDETVLASGINNGSNLTNLTIIDVEVNGNRNTYHADYSAFGGSHYSCLRCHGYDAPKIFQTGDGTTIEDSVGHSQYSLSPVMHTETIYADGADDTVIRHNYLQADTTSAPTAALGLLGTWEEPSNVLIEDNYFEGFDGAGVMFSGGAGRNHTNTVFRNNVISNNNGWGGTTPTKFWMCDPTNSASGNVIVDNATLTVSSWTPICQGQPGW